MNWRLKIILKIILTRLPIPYRVWKKIGLFKFGQMDTSNYAEKIFNLHFRHFSNLRQKSGFTVLELGPGDSALSALYAYLHGANAIYLIDVGDFVNTSVNTYRNAYDRWCETNVTTRKSPDFKSFACFMSSVNAIYLTNGVDDLQNIKANSIDFIFSHSVLEHVRKDKLDNVLRELYRISAIEAISSHNVDYMDHLAGGQNNLYFSDAVWESEFFANSGFYTNRIPPHRMHQKISDAGFNVIYEQFGSWSILSLEESEVHRDLRGDYNRRLSAPTSSLVLTKNK